MRFGEIKDIGGIRIHAGRFKIKNWSFTRRNVMWWLGTEALIMKIVPPGDFTWQVRIQFKRIWWRIINRFFEHWVHSTVLSQYLKCVGIKKTTYVFHWPEAETQTRTKLEHDGFNVLVYLPTPSPRNQRYRDWIYCRDEIEALMPWCPEMNFIVADGSLYMPKIWPVVDAFIQPNRFHHITSRMTASAKLMNIPVLIQDCFENNRVENINQMKEWLEKQHALSLENQKNL